MENKELFRLWQEQESKIEGLSKTLQNVQTTVKGLQARPYLLRFTSLKVRTIIGFCLYVAVLGALLFLAATHYSRGLNYFIVSMAAILTINLVALANNVKELVYAKKLDIQVPVMIFQEQLAKLQLMVVKHSRTLMLQIPFWTTFSLSSSWFPQHCPWYVVLVLVLFCASSVYLTVWLYRNQTLENSSKSWFKALLQSTGWISLQKAEEEYRDILDYRKEGSIRE